MSSYDSCKFIWQVYLESFAFDFFLQLRIKSSGLTYKCTVEWYPTSIINVKSDKSSFGEDTLSQTTKNKYFFDTSHSKPNSFLKISII